MAHENAWLLGISKIQLVNASFWLVELLVGYML